eukprot:TRINITY_DN84834_c0_g1_i1.p1 TRINITY_DN84834_c0_g1~~TRINITY_DN84834_c0_g1_i1.p1  ORF type:complete len:246 (-),score=37.30 TRINITY_DN84834_c0_g1_i1:117-854(-)
MGASFSVNVDEVLALAKHVEGKDEPISVFVTQSAPYCGLVFLQNDFIFPGYSFQDEATQKVEERSAELQKTLENSPFFQLLVGDSELLYVLYVCHNFKIEDCHEKYARVYTIRNAYKSVKGGFDKTTPEEADTRILGYLQHYDNKVKHCYLKEDTRTWRHLQASVFDADSHPELFAAFTSGFVEFEAFSQGRKPNITDDQVLRPPAKEDYANPLKPVVTNPKQAHKKAAAEPKHKPKKGKPKGNP